MQQPADARLEHFRREKERRFVHLLILRTYKEVLDLCHWYETGEHLTSLRYAYGIHKSTEREAGYKKALDEINAWIHSENFWVLCKRIGQEEYEARQVVGRLLEGHDRERIKALIDEYELEEMMYALPRGPRPEADQAPETQSAKSA